MTPMFESLAALDATLTERTATSSSATCAGPTAAMKNLMRDLTGRQAGS